MYNIIEVVSRKSVQLTPDITLDSRIRIRVVVTDFTPVIPLTILFNVQAWFHLFQFSYSGKDPEFTMNMGSFCQNEVFFCEFLKFNSSYSQTNGNRACETNYTIRHFSVYTMHCRIDLQMCWVSNFQEADSQYIPFCQPCLHDTLPKFALLRVIFIVSFDVG